MPLPGARVAFDDHPNAERFNSEIETISADSVLSWRQRADFAGPPITIP